MRSDLSAPFFNVQIREHLACYSVLCDSHLGPLVTLWVVALDVVEVLLPVIPSHGVDLVAEQTDADGVARGADGRHQGPRVRLRVVPAEHKHSSHWLVKSSAKNIKVKQLFLCCILDTCTEN